MFCCRDVYFDVKVLKSKEISVRPYKQIIICNFKLVFKSSNIPA